MKRWVILLLVLLLLSIVMGALATRGQTQSGTTSSPMLTTEALRMDQLAASQGESSVIDRLSAEFKSFLGNDSRAVVTGLRKGTPITLTTTAPTTAGAKPVTATTTIDPPTGNMSFGNVFISLALAKQQLGQIGITRPTPRELRATLLGGTVTTAGGATATTSANLQGILTMRSEHMGWGQIAQRLGVKLGSVVRGLKSANQGLAAGSSSPTGGGILKAGGQSAGSSVGDGEARGHGR